MFYNSQTCLLIGLLITMSVGCTLLAAPPGMFIKIFLFFCNSCFTELVSWALCISANKVFPVNPGVAGSRKWLLQSSWSSLTHDFIIFSSSVFLRNNVLFLRKNHANHLAGILKVSVRSRYVSLLIRFACVLYHCLLIRFSSFLVSINLLDNSFSIIENIALTNQN